jgi:hypothetical protein
MDRAVRCLTCGRVPDDPDGRWRLTWTAQRAHGQRAWCCDRCSRENLRSIEANLDPRWW